MNQLIESLRHIVGSAHVFTDGDLSIAQGIRGALGLDLVDDFLELEGQVFGNNAGFLPGEDVGQRLRRGKRA